MNYQPIEHLPIVNLQSARIRHTRERLVHSGGFTLIELLVVIAVIAIIAAILFPVFARARDRARQITCLSNERQLGIAAQEYVDDYDEHYPNLAVGDSGDGVVGTWIYYANFSAGFDVTRGTLYPYVKNKGVYICPDDVHADANQLSYAMNSCLAGTANGNLLLGKPMAEFPNSSQIMLLGEEADNAFVGDADPSAGGTNTDTTDDGYFLYQTNSYSTRHNGGSNVVFLDSHAKWCTASYAMESNFFTGGPAACP